MELGPKNHNGDGLLGPNSIVVVYMDPLALGFKYHHPKHWVHRLRIKRQRNCLHLINESAPSTVEMWDVKTRDVFDTIPTQTLEETCFCSLSNKAIVEIFQFFIGLTSCYEACIRALFATPKA